MNTPTRCADALDRAQVLVRAGIPLPPRSYFEAIARLDSAAQVLDEVLAGPDPVREQLGDEARRRFVDARAGALAARIARGNALRGAL